MKNKRHIYLISLVLVWGLTNVVIGLVPSDLSIEIVIDNDGLFYVVNEQGDLTIQINGEMVGVLPINCDFELKIPDEFQISNLSDDTPVLEMVNGGTPLEISVNNDEFNSIFALRTFNSTLLPMSYDLNIISLQKNFTQVIIPMWPGQNTGNQKAGGGASITVLSPYITSFYAYDSYKGDTEHVKTYIYNPTPFLEFYLSEMKYKISSSYYMNWHDWTPEYSKNALIYAYQTYVAHDYLNPLFSGSNGKYALNVGTYHVTQVKASGDGWSDTYNPSVSQGEFITSLQSGTHPVYVFQMADEAFINHFGTPWLEGLDNVIFIHWEGGSPYERSLNEFYGI
ncbi:MAG: hypothetical protein ACW99F_09740, partial [Candidatus Hodarchaeales archaeon]